MKPHDSVSVSAAARALKIHRATVHRYLVQNPEIRNARGKVVINRLKEAIESAKASEPRGRRCSMSPLQIKRSRANNLGDGIQTPAAMRFVIKKLITADQVAHTLGYSRDHVWRLCKTGKLPHLRINTRTIRFDADEIQAWIASGQQPLKPRAERLP